MSDIEYSVADSVATITLNRPDKLNAFAGTMREDLVEKVTAAAEDEAVRAVVITGAGRAFCAGGDVETMAQLQREKRAEDFSRLLTAGKKVVLAVRHAPKPVIAAVNGVAAGAGFNLALACDFRIASATVKLGQTFVRIGLHPDWGGTYFLPRLIGPSRAMELMMTGRIVEGEEALKLGLVDRLVSPESLQEEAAHFARTLAAGPPIATAAVKRAVYASLSNDLEAQIDLEAVHQLRAFSSKDAAEGMAAFFEKRTPSFRGE